MPHEPKVMVGGLIACLLAVSACADSAPKRDSVIASDEPAVARCLVAAGASVARSLDDVGFFGRGREASAADNPGFVISADRTFIVDRWEAAPSAEDQWTLWAGQPLSESAVIDETAIRALLTDDSPETFVAFMQRPSAQEVTAAGRCLRALARG